MQGYKKMYTTLFNAITDALECMKQQDCAAAMEILICAQQETEEIYMDSGEFDCNNKIISIDTYI